MSLGGVQNGGGGGLVEGRPVPHFMNINTEFSF